VDRSETLLVAFHRIRPSLEETLDRHTFPM
jgi:hypothetical protein